MDNNREVVCMLLKQILVIFAVFTMSSNAMSLNIDTLRDQLKIDEGVKYEIYKDHLGYLTFGIGHLVVEVDEEYGSYVGTSVTRKRVEEVFNQDIREVISNCSKLFNGWEEYPEEVKQILANMMFNMGIFRLGKFEDMIGELENRQWTQAAKAGRDSLWYTQVPNRAERLMSRLEKVEKT